MNTEKMNTEKQIEELIHYFMREVPLSEIFGATLLDAIAGITKEIVMLNEKNDYLETKILLMKQYKILQSDSSDKNKGGEK